MSTPAPALRIASRSIVDEPAASTSTAGLISAEVGGLHAQWRRTIETMKASLAGLEQACDSAMDSRDAEVASIVAKLVERAESERDERQRQCQQQIASAEAEAEALRGEVHAQKMELSKLQMQLDAAIAERAKLQETFRLVQRALALGTAEPVAVAAEAIAIPSPSAVATAPVVEEPAAPVATDQESVWMNLHPDAVEDITRVVEQVEAMYRLDMESGRSGIEIVDSLTNSLRHARSLITTRWSSGTFDAQPLFDYQIGRLLEREAATSFGRHLGIAAYASRTPVGGENVPAVS